MPSRRLVSNIAVPSATSIESGTPTQIIQIVFRIACQNCGSLVNMNR
jgi:hypothetical protein